MNKRILALQQMLQKNQIDGAVYATSASMQYLLCDHEYHWQRTMYCGGLPHMWKEGLAGHFNMYPDRMLYIPCEGEAVLVETFECAEDMAHIPVKQVACYFHRLMDEMRPYLTGHRIALGEACRVYLEAMLEEFAPQALAVDGEAFVLGMRKIKDSDEIETMRRAARFTDEAMEKTVGILKPGVTKGEVERFLARIGEEAGLRDVSFPPAAPRPSPLTSDMCWTATARTMAAPSTAARRRRSMPGDTGRCRRRSWSCSPRSGRV